MKQGIYTIKENTNIAKSVYKMTLIGDTSAINTPGQFVNIALDGHFLRRPISVAAWDKSCFTIIYKTVGEGTMQMSQMKVGEQLDILTGLGNGYDLNAIPAEAFLIGGGVGVPPMLGLAAELVKLSKKPQIILGFNTKAEIFCEAEFKALGLDPVVTTADGSYGIKGFVTDALQNIISGASCTNNKTEGNGGTKNETYICACGPEPMLKAVYSKCADGQFSFESRMGCGFGACMGCTCRTKYGSKRICADGPVLTREEIVW